ncbi:ATP/ADP translocase [Anaerocolumna cellulosilytica]|nr:ATP/ADP translocase [Anaerocolumna cellulosilytica]
MPKNRNYGSKHKNASKYSNGAGFKESHPTMTKSHYLSDINNH